MHEVPDLVEALFAEEDEEGLNLLMQGSRFVLLVVRGGRAVNHEVLKILKFRTIPKEIRNYGTIRHAAHSLNKLRKVHLHVSFAVELVHLGLY